jgi:uncharacterized protein (TIGR02588 family)
MRRPGGAGRSLAEWVTLALSFLVVGSLIAVALEEESIRQEEDGSSLLVTFDINDSRREGNSFAIPYTVLNTGSEAISSADVWIDVYDGEALVESAEITVEFLPLQGQQRGEYVSAYDPATHTLRGRVESLQFP